MDVEVGVKWDFWMESGGNWGGLEERGGGVVRKRTDVDVSVYYFPG